MDASSSEREYDAGPGSFSHGVWQAKAILIQFAERQNSLIEAERNSELHSGFRNSTAEFINRTSKEWSASYRIQNSAQLDTLIRKLRLSVNQRLRAWTFAQLEEAEKKSKTAAQSVRACLERYPGFHPRWIPRFDPDRSHLLHALDHQFSHEPSPIGEDKWKSLSRIQSWRAQQIASILETTVLQLFQLEIKHAERLLQSEMESYKTTCLLAIRHFTKDESRIQLR